MAAEVVVLLNTTAYSRLHFVDFVVYSTTIFVVCILCMYSLSNAFIALLDCIEAKTVLEENDEIQIRV